MKKLLLASTALVLSAGMATAQGVRVTGDARMGVAYTSVGSDNFRFVARARTTFTGSGTTDGGLSFGMSFRVDNGAGAVGGGAGLTAMSGGNVFISGAFGRLTMGDVDGAAEWIVGDLHGVGLTGNTGIGQYHEFAYLANDHSGSPSATANRPAARYQYSMGDFRFAVSANNPGATAPQVWSIGAAFDFQGFTFGIGYENEAAGVDGVLSTAANSASHWIIGASGSFADVSFRAAYGQASVGGVSQEQYGISVAAGIMPGTSVRAFYRNDFANVDFYGLGFTYDLGGGASLVGGIARDTTGTGTTQADFGVALRF